MAGHDHIDMFFDCVDSIGFCRAGTAWKDVGPLNKRYHVRSMTTTSTLNVVGMNRAILERRSCPLDEA